MPLTPGAPVSDTIKELYHNGSHPRPMNQIVAIAEANHRKRAGGGIVDAGASSQPDQFHKAGLFPGDGAGRTDRLPRTVPAESFVFPADTVSALGQGHTLAGAKILDGIFSGPHKRADGGNTPGMSQVMVASGEYLANRDDIGKIGARLRKAGKSKAKTDLAAGHEWARDFVSRIRDLQKKWLASAPKPKA